MSGTFTYSFVNKTNPSPYHQILALSQNMINNAFENMWLIADSDSLLHTFNVDNRGGEYLKGKVKAPKVTLHVTSLDVQLHYLLQFDSGSLSLYVSNDSKDNTMKNWDVTGWIFAFPISIASKTIDKDDPKYSTYTEKMGLPEGDFSLAQLLLDSSRAGTWDSKLSYFGGEDWSKETAAIQAHFATFVTEWINSMITEGKTILGIVLQANQPSTVNGHAPSFPPTSLDYYMYPWIDPSNPGSPTNGLDQNALCYLLMTGNVKPPAPAVINYSGTFVDASSDHGGVLCMNTSQFWDTWFLPIFQELNKASEVVPTPPVCEYSDCTFTVAPEFTEGNNPNHTDQNDPYFSFQAAPGSGWSWQGQTLEANASVDDGTGQGGVVTQSAIASSKIGFGSGGQNIAVTGTNVFTFTAKPSWVSTNSIFKITTNWHVNYALGVVNDGGLQIVRISDPPGTQAATTTGESISDAGGWSIPWDTYTQYISGHMNGFIEKYMGNIENSLIHALQHHHKLFLPASGTFLMKNAEFNSRGDLMVSLHYNGATPPSEAPKTPEHLQKLPARAARRLVLTAPKRTLVSSPSFKFQHGEN